MHGLSIRFFPGVICLIFLCAQAALAQAAPVRLPEDANRAVILAYHRVGEELPAADNLSAEQFAAHVREIESGGYTVLPLREILGALKSGAPLPPRTIAITFEGAYLSALRNAIPLLSEKKLPFSVFYASDSLDQKLPEYMSWEDLLRLEKGGNVTLGVLPARYAHTAHGQRRDMIAGLNRARQRFRETFGHEVDFLSYPYGEYSLELKDLAKTQGFKFALGLHSGAVYADSDFYALPRFSMTERYGDLERFRMIADSLPLPVTDAEPADPLLGKGEWLAGFTLPAALERESQSLSCFISGQKTPKIQRLGRRVEIRSAETGLVPERIRMNCTMPGPPEDGADEGRKAQTRWRWFGAIYHRPGADEAEDAAAVRSIPPQDELQELQE